jgi:arylsulfatase A-like enzyme
MGAEQGAVCVPSRAMLMTGRTLFHIKANLAGQTTWPEAFGRSGYATFITGKWHNEAESALRSFQEGKAVFLGGMGDPYKLLIQDISPRHTFVNKRTSGQHSVKLFADAAIEFLRRPKLGRPFLCYVAFNAPHDPRVAPQQFHDYYNARKPPAPANFLPQHPFNNGFMKGRDEELAPWPRTPEIVRQHLADYYASIEFLDREIGRILAALDESGQSRNTIIVFASDQGLAIGSHGLFGKQNLYEHSMRAPLVFSGPGIPRGQKTDAMCYLLDVFPTLGELAGVQGPEESEGRNLAPVLTGRQAKGRDSIFTAFMKVQRAVRDERFKLIVYPRVNKTQLFDLQSDPIEMNDLAGDPRYAGEVERLKTLLQNWQRGVGDVQPLSTTKPDPLELNLSKTRPAKKKAAKP